MCFTLWNGKKKTDVERFCISIELYIIKCHFLILVYHISSTLSSNFIKKSSKLGACYLTIPLKIWCANRYGFNVAWIDCRTLLCHFWHFSFSVWGISFYSCFTHRPYIIFQFGDVDSSIRDQVFYQIHVIVFFFHFLLFLWEKINYLSSFIYL